MHSYKEFFRGYNRNLILCLMNSLCQLFIRSNIKSRRFIILLISILSQIYYIVISNWEFPIKIKYFYIIFFTIFSNRIENKFNLLNIRHMSIHLLDKLSCYLNHWNKSFFIIIFYLKQRTIYMHKIVSIYNKIFYFW
jgi:hypothetical protein